MPHRVHNLYQKYGSPRYNTVGEGRPCSRCGLDTNGQLLLYPAEIWIPYCWPCVEKTAQPLNEPDYPGTRRRSGFFGTNTANPGGYKSWDDLRKQYMSFDPAYPREDPRIRDQHQHDAYHYAWSDLGPKSTAAHKDEVELFSVLDPLVNLTSNQRKQLARAYFLRKRSEQE